MTTDEPLPEVWTEKVVVGRLREGLSDIPGGEMMSGQGGANAFGPADWGLVGRQRFQYGDFRFETERLVAVVEIDTAGGVTNLVKYWPYLAARPDAVAGRRFLIAHVFASASANDYISHLRLWDFVAERMRDDLAKFGVAYPTDWEARRFVGRDVALSVKETVAFIREALE